MKKYKLNFYIDLSEKKEVSEKERIDYRKIFHIPNVIKDQLVAEIIEKETDKEEKYIFDSLEKAQYIFDKQDFYFDPEDPSKIYASISGKIYEKDGKFFISEKMEVENVDYSTGNIFFVGDLIVKDRIKSGFEVRARNIYVNGNINNAMVTAGEKLVVKGGIIGIQGKSTCHIRADKMIVANFIENSIVECNGSIFVKKSIMHSDIYSGEKIVMSEKPGYIVGGNILAKKSIMANVVGSKWGTHTILKVGIDPFKYLKLKELLNRKESREKLLEEVEKSLKYLNEVLEKGKGTNEEREELEKEIKEIRLKKKKFMKNLERIEKIINKLKTEIEEDKKLAHIEGGKIYIFEKIFPGVEIKVGLDSLRIYDEMSGKFLFYYKDEKIKIKELTN